MFSGCSIEKRRYTHGYHIEWNSAKPDVKRNESVQSRKQNEEDKASADKPVAPVNIKSDEPVTVSADNSAIIAYHRIKRSNHYARIVTEDCDVIILNFGDEIKGKVIEVTQTDVKYKKCGDQSGDIYSVKKSLVFMIKYANGTKDVFREETFAPKERPVEEKKSGIFGILSLISIVSAFILGYSLGGITTFGFILFLIALGGIGIWQIALFIILIAAAIVFGLLGIDKKRKHRGLAITGLILGLATVFIILIYALLLRG